MRKLIVQGLTAEAHRSAIEEMLIGVEIHRFLVSVAFATSSGVRAMTHCLAPVADRTTVIVGIRNGVTTAQGIHKLAELGLDLWVVDTGSMGRIFHPKLYFVQGKSEARLMVGSANLTGGGLWSNIEASYVDTLDYDNKDDFRIVSSVIDMFDALQNSYQSNVFNIQKNVSLDELLADPRFVDERNVREESIFSGIPTENYPDSVPRMDLYYRPPSVALPVRGIGDFVNFAQNAGGSEYIISWVSRPLTPRDLSMPVAGTTNPTGSMGMKKGLMDDAVDHRHYFYDQVFNQLEWRYSRTPGKVEASALFRIVIKGVHRGNYFLIVNHDTRIDTPSYRQRNFMTQLHWGEALPVIRDQDLLGRTMRLSRASANAAEFLIEIE
jgi:HKD family nuclease